MSWGRSPVQMQSTRTQTPEPFRTSGIQAADIRRVFAALRTKMLTPVQPSRYDDFGLSQGAIA